MFRKFWGAAFVVTALAATAAWAADLPTRKGPPVFTPPPPLPFSWTGLYVGGQIGWAWADDQANVNAFDPGKAGTRAGARNSPGRPRS